MSARRTTSLALAAVAAALFAGAACHIDTPQFTWDPGDPARVGLGVAGLFAAGAALRCGRRPRGE